MNTKQFIIVVLSLLLFSSIFAIAATPTWRHSVFEIYDSSIGKSTGWLVDGQGCDVAYCIYHPFYNSSATYAKNGTTGAIDYSGTTKAVINSALNLLTSDRNKKEKVVVIGLYNDTVAVNISNYTILDISQAEFRGNATQIIINGTWDANIHDVDIVGGVLNGTIISHVVASTGFDSLLRISNVSGISLDGTHIINGYSRGLLITNMNNSVISRIHTENNGNVGMDIQSQGAISLNLTNNLIFNPVSDRDYGTGITPGLGSNNILISPIINGTRVKAGETSATGLGMDSTNGWTVIGGVISNVENGWGVGYFSSISTAPVHNVIVGTSTHRNGKGGYFIGGANDLQMNDIRSRLEPTNMWISGSNEVRVSGFMFTNATNESIKIQSSDQIYIENGYIADADRAILKYAAINITDGSSNVNIKGNVILENTAAPTMQGINVSSGSGTTFNIFINDNDLRLTNANFSKIRRLDATQYNVMQRDNLDLAGNNWGGSPFAPTGTRVHKSDIYTNVTSNYICMYNSTDWNYLNGTSGC